MRERTGPASCVEADSDRLLLTPRSTLPQSKFTVQHLNPNDIYIYYLLYMCGSLYLWSPLAHAVGNREPGVLLHSLSQL